ncbi:helix-turn-helix domain-containing protein [Sphaerisporangium dianthi]|uniref:Helix-turn-helix domain-containing protein n=1 Tax=Sphaerisporangium dianthi TaxID=1436120 RepID=A0ABV9CL50_9ACTN
MSSQGGAHSSGLKYLTVEETATLLHISTWKVFDLIRTGELASFKPGRLRLIPESALQDYVTRMIEEAA